MGLSYRPKNSYEEQQRVRSTMKKLQTIIITALFCSFQQSGAAQAGEAERCVSFETKIKKCMALHGAETQRKTNTQWRESHVPTIVPEEQGFTMVFLDESIEKPIAAQMTGIRLISVLSEEEIYAESKCPAREAKPDAETKNKSASELWAKVRLPEEFQELCGTNHAYLQVDDHLGVESQVIAIYPEGIP